jgi:4a-hydroxytetrahydrobiopterin dehydratase
MPNLSQKHCVPCEGGTKPLEPFRNSELIKEINTWQLIEDKAIEKTLLFKDFTEALAFVNKVGALAEAEGHHPDISIFGWNKVKLSLSTHAIGGLSDNDFILASKIDELNHKED